MREDRRGISYTVGDGAVLPFRPAAFDAVTAFMSLMDVGNPERTLAEIARVLRATAAAHPEVADTRIVPYFLIVRARKPGPFS